MPYSLILHIMLVCKVCIHCFWLYIYIHKAHLSSVFGIISVYLKLIYVNCACAVYFFLRVLTYAIVLH